MLLLKAGEQGWLLSSEYGTHEFSRVFWVGGKYVLRDGSARLGPAELLHADIDDEGLTLNWSDQRKSRIPRSWFQYTWRGVSS